jgi:NADPH-dependent glutamate synthase beta subunit-like oxidoreductase
MKKIKALGPDIQNLHTYRELPIGATAVGLPKGRKTGLWRYMRPTISEKISPCQEACPAGNWIQRFVASTASGDLDEAWGALKLENPFPGVCGRVCYHPCEEFCTRKEFDGATSIHLIERTLADNFFKKRLTPPVIIKKQGKKTAVVGSGPAGLACAYFLRVLGYEVILFEAQNELGGIPQTGIPAYRLPKRILNKEIDDIISLGIEVKKGCKIGKDMNFSDLFTYDAVFLATGAHQTHPLDIPGTINEGVYQGMDFLARYNTERAIDMGERVLVIGGGNVAIDVSRTLIRLGIQPTLLYRRTRNEMPAHPEEIEDALAEGAQLQYLLSPVLIRKAEKSALILECTQMEIQGIDPDGRPKAVPIEGKRVHFEADQVVLATGEAPDLSYLPKEFDLSKNRLWVNEWGQTSVYKVFAGGDMIDQPWNISAAIGSAKRAAIAMDHFLRGDDLQSLARQGALSKTMREHINLERFSKPGQKEVATFQDINLSYSHSSPRKLSDKLQPTERICDFREVNLGLSSDAAIEESGRCLSCGVCKMCGNCYLFCPDGAVQINPETERYAINYEYCKGCGICQNECPVGAITIETQGAL